MNRNYAQDFRQFRKERGWTQDEMALTLDITARTIRNIEAGRHPPIASTRVKMRELQKKYREDAE